MISIKKIVKKFIFKCICYGLYFITKAISLTLKIKRVNWEIFLEAQNLSPTKSVIFAYWHENICASLVSHAHMGIVPMISRSKDGELINFIAKKFGYDSVRGSSNRGGKEAKEQMVQKILHENKHGAFAADGPRGPRHELKAGVIAVARDTQAPIVPAIAISTKFWVFKKTWDKTRIPKPFSTIIVMYDKPIFVSKDLHGADFNNIKEGIAQILNNLEQKAFSYISKHYS